MPPEQLVRRHLAVRRRLLAAETERDDLSANLRRLAGVHEKLEGELREAGGVGDEDAKDAQGELDDHAFATIDVDKESLIERHLLAISKLTATEAECASLAATAEGVEEKNCELRAEIRRRKYARLGGESVRIDVGRVAQGMGDDDDDDDVDDCCVCDVDYDDHDGDGHDDYYDDHEYYDCFCYSGDDHDDDDDDYDDEDDDDYE